MTPEAAGHLEGAGMFGARPDHPCRRSRRRRCAQRLPCGLSCCTSPNRRAHRKGRQDPQRVHVTFARLRKSEPRVDVELRRFLPQSFNLKAVADYELGPGAVIPRAGRRRYRDGNPFRGAHCGPLSVTVGITKFVRRAVGAGRGATNSRAGKNSTLSGELQKRSGHVTDENWTGLK